MLLDHAFSLKSCIYFSKFLLMGFFLPFLVVRELALKVFHIYVVNFSSLRVKKNIYWNLEYYKVDSIFSIIYTKFN